MNLQDLFTLQIINKVPVTLLGHPSVAAKKIIDENNIQAEQIEGTGKGGRITKQDILQLLASLPEEGNRKSEVKYHLC